jgi:hypothetical protein
LYASQKSLFSVAELRSPDLGHRWRINERSIYS